MIGGIPPDPAPVLLAGKSLDRSWPRSSFRLIPDNRRASVVWGYDTSASIDWELGPKTAQVEFTVPIRSLPTGNHTIHAVLL